MQEVVAVALEITQFQVERVDLAAAGKAELVDLELKDRLAAQILVVVQVHQQTEQVADIMVDQEL
jgi:hypothetical protein